MQVLSGSSASVAPQVQDEDLETGAKIDFSFDEEDEDEAFKEDINATLDDEEASGQHYFEQVAFHTGKNASSLNSEFSSAAQDDDGDYEKVQVISGVPTYENVQFSDEKKADNEGLYTIGRRFPSIRVKGKKEEKKAKILKDSAAEVNHQTGSCVKAVTAIYAYHGKSIEDQHDLEESNIYENGHIVIKQQKGQRPRPACCLCQFVKRRKSTILLFVMVMSVLSFILTGGWLLYTSGIVT